MNDFAQHKYSELNILFNFIQLVGFSFAGQCDKAGHNIKPVRTWFNGSTWIVSASIGGTGVPAAKLIFKAKNIGYCTIKDDILPVKETPAQIQTPVRQHFLAIKNRGIRIVVNTR